MGGEPYEDVLKLKLPSKKAKRKLRYEDVPKNRTHNTHGATGMGSFYTHTMRYWEDGEGVGHWQRVPRDHTNQVLTVYHMGLLRDQAQNSKQFKAAVGKYYGKKVAV